MTQMNVGEQREEAFSKQNGIGISLETVTEISLQ